MKNIQKMKSKKRGRPFVGMHKIHITLQNTMHDRIAKMADENETSVASICRLLIKKSLRKK